MVRLPEILSPSRAIAFGALVALTALLVWPQFGIGDRLQLSLFDTYQRLAPRARVSAPVVVVDIDEKSLRMLGQWPWPRSLLARLVSRIAEGRPAAIGIDVLMPESDRLSPDQLSRLVLDIDSDVAGRLSRLPSNDSVLAGAIQRSPAVVAIFGSRDGRHYGSDAPIRFVGDPMPFVERFPSLLRSVGEIDQAATGHGLINATVDDDGVVRRVPLLALIGDKFMLHFVVEMLRVATSVPLVTVHSSWSGVQRVVVGDRAIPTEKDGTLRMRYGWHDGSRSVSAGDVLLGSVSPDVVSRRLVLIGVSAAGVGDRHASPLGETLPGSEVHAQLIEMMFDGSWLVRPRWAPMAEAVWMIGAGLLVIAITPALTVLRSTSIILGLVAASALLSVFLYARHGLLIDGGGPATGLAALYVVVLSFTLTEAQRQRRQIKRAFQYYVHPGVVEEIVRNPKKLVLGGERRELTILFADLAGFTAMSERLPPEAVARVLTRCLTTVSRVVVAHGGTIDKYIGDCIMAFWGAPIGDPQHALRGCQAAIAMQQALAVLRDELAAEGLPQVHMRIGINSGTVVVGNMGSEDLFDYTAVGDAVNLASRLEAVNKLYGSQVIAGEVTARLLDGRLAAWRIDKVRVQGRAEPVEVYVLPLRQDVVATDWPSRVDGAIAAYRGQRWDEAVALWAGLENCEEVSQLSAVYLHRIERFRQEPTRRDWDGSVPLETK